MAFTQKPDPFYQINVVSGMVGLSQKRLRDYERLGLVKPRRQARTNNRLYTQADIDRLCHIKRLVHVHGFTLKCIQYLVSTVPCWTIFQCTQRDGCPAYDAAHRPCYEVKASADATATAAAACRRCPVYLNRGGASLTLLPHE